MLGTWVNVGAVLVGSLVGLLAGRRVPEAIPRSAAIGVGLVTLVLGTQLAIGTENALVLLLALLIGGGLGTWLRIEHRLARLGEMSERWFPAAVRGAIPQGFVAATLLFCVGPMAILGSIRDGVYGDWRILGLKAVMDGITSIGLVAGLGPGVFLSAASLLIYQGAITLGAKWLMSPGAALTPGVSGGLTPSVGESLASSPALTELNAVGGAVLIALSFKLLGIRDLKVGNLLPALALAPLFAYVASLLMA
jgi:uncharacterized membrane protein YqgA involved in biofilm formation